MLYIFGAIKKKDLALKPDQAFFLINSLPQSNKLGISKKLTKVIFWFVTIQGIQSIHIIKINEYRF